MVGHDHAARGACGRLLGHEGGGGTGAPGRRCQGGLLVGRGSPGGRAWAMVVRGRRRGESGVHGSGSKP
jgi:hypothetical protein